MNTKRILGVALLTVAVCVGRATEAPEPTAALLPALATAPQLQCPAEMEVFKPLVGEWTISGQMRFPGDDWRAIEGTSVIRPDLAGCFVVEEYELHTPDQKYYTRISAFRSYDVHEKTYRTVYIDDELSLTDVHEGTRIDAGALQMDNARRGASKYGRGKSVLTRSTHRDVRADSFQLDWESSLDGGKTWEPLVSAIYVRRSS